MMEAGSKVSEKRSGSPLLRGTTYSTLQTGLQRDNNAGSD